MENCSVVDLFCGIGGLTHGFSLEGFQVVAGIDADDSCRYAYETNNPGAQFISQRIEDVRQQAIIAFYPQGHIKILVGCAPCQPFSPYNKKGRGTKDRWRLLPQFAELICQVLPDVVSMENVPELATFQKGRAYSSFVGKLQSAGYHVTEYKSVYCPDYGIPQSRTRLVLFASRHGAIELLQRTHTPDEYPTVRSAIGDLECLDAGGTSVTDPLHRAASLSELNLRRIQASLPGGTWEDWDEDLRAECHMKESGKTYRSVYGRMEWDRPAPTMTTQCYGFGSGRFGHPEQDRAISLREAALLQTFPSTYGFVGPGYRYYFKTLGRYIGNAVPVQLARVIARSIERHLAHHLGEANDIRAGGTAGSQTQVRPDDQPECIESFRDRVV
ncbi:MAG: DNA (cytosine-5-)-methyltransferase [Ardenticatenales bacterium]|nr:DNA (cytosine-5-)-methyltransferase [Ardenticatenales bacterium]